MNKNKDDGEVGGMENVIQEGISEEMTSEWRLKVEWEPQRCPGKGPSRQEGGQVRGKLRLREGEKTSPGSCRTISDMTRRGEPLYCAAAKCKTPSLGQSPAIAKPYGVSQGSLDPFQRWEV